MIVVEPMREGDVASVRRIEGSSFATTWPDEAFLNELKTNRSAHYLVARQGEEVLGYAGVWLVLDEAHITSIAVDPERRGGGLGKRLLYHLLRSCQALGARWATLEVRVDNEVALKMYRRFGFARIGLRKGYYESGHDAVIMWAGNLQSRSFDARLDRIASTLS
ncbi:ribosomal-protein-alanine N-acetyltransferase [bacterium CPR1]|nr:ribosomal-protein-alanine N-acetyltransferase [bacterium CPR1]